MVRGIDVVYKIWGVYRYVYYFLKIVVFVFLQQIYCLESGRGCFR